MPQLEFFGESLKDCLNQIREKLGSEAIIVETRKVRRGGRLGIGGQEVFCVVAEREDRPLVPIPSKPVAPVPVAIKEESDPDIRAVQEALDRIRQRAKEESQATPPPPSKSRLNLPTPSQSAAVAVARQSNLSQPTSPRTTRLDALPNPNSKNLIRRATFPKVTQEEVRALQNPEPPKATASTFGSRLQQPSPKTTQAPVPKPNSTLPPIKNLKALTRPQPAASHVAPTREEPLTQNISQLKENLQHLRQRFSSYERNLSAVVTQGSSAFRQAGELAWLQEKMEQQGIAPALLLEMIHQLHELHDIAGESSTPAQMETYLTELIAQRLSCAGAIQLAPHRLKTVALVGPTGVGKTTTIAKLAAHYALVERRNVALLTIDTYRIAAVEQLKTYSQIIDLPLCVAHRLDDIAPALREFSNYDLLLVDTAGRSQHNTPQIEELKPYLEALRCETHLVLAAPTKESDLLETARRFSLTRLDRILFSKLDETSTYGTLLNVSDRVGIPLSYITTGQKVPEDISIAEPHSIAGLILNSGY